MNLTGSVAVYSLKTDVTSYDCEICSRYTSALCSPSRIRLRTALVCRSFITKDTNLCCPWRPYSTTNKGEVWALQRTKKHVGLRRSVLAIKFKHTNKQNHYHINPNHHSALIFFIDCGDITKG